VVVETRTRNVDVWPTILDLLGLEPPPGIDGRSRLPDILSSPSEGGPDGTGRIAIADLDQTWGQRDTDPLPAIAVVEDTFRYVRTERAKGRREQLFDASDDPHELRDLATEEPETLERLSAIADEYYETEPAWGAAPTRELDELELNLLRALGYKIE
jgi:arylsulfatase A-like enzyme